MLHTGIGHLHDYYYEYDMYENALTYKLIIIE